MAHPLTRVLERSFQCGFLTLAIIFSLYLAISLILKPSSRSPAQYQPFAPPNTSLSTIPKGGPRLLCMVLTCPGNILTRAVHIEATWGRLCHKLVFLSDTSDPAPEGLASEVWVLGGCSGRQGLWSKVKQGLQRVERDLAGQFDFLLKADDDTFVVSRNLDQLLGELVPGDPFLLGHRQSHLGVQYVSGGPGYLLSRTAVSLIAQSGLSPGGPCHLPAPVGTEVSDIPSEDLQMGACVRLLDIPLLPSLDRHGRSRFLPFHLEQHLVASLASTFWLEHDPECRLEQCVSEQVVGLHYVRPEQMYILDFLFRNRQETGKS